MTHAQRTALIAFHKRMAEAYAKEGQHKKAAHALDHARKLQTDMTGWDTGEGIGVITDAVGNLLEHY